MTQLPPHLLHIVVHSPALDGSRRVTERGVLLGVASHLDDVFEILRFVGLDRFQVEECDFISWQGGGPAEWPGITADNRMSAGSAFTGISDSRRR
ncbi:hypothetical protein ABTX34_32415 [Streptomyces sp. NPDC096538]|uniref:hypothetical protein n=1 Tax=Streptomyces sp. NPDC096538 TaxID=3155427 RepID=UPI003318BB97